MPSNTRPSVRRSREQWQRLIDEQHNGDLTQRAFCQKNSIAVSSFCNWNRRLSQEESANPSAEDTNWLSPPEQLPAVDQPEAEQQQRIDLVNSNPLSKALKYAANHQAQMRVYLTDPDVPIDTNHVERNLRGIPLGRKNWMFCWTEVGAHHVGIIQSLITSCRLQGIDPYTYLVDVLQRVSVHPAKKVEELTPRLWKEHFASTPLRSDVGHTDD